MLFILFELINFFVIKLKFLIKKIIKKKIYINNLKELVNQNLEHFSYIEDNFIV